MTRSPRLNQRQAHRDTLFAGPRPLDGRARLHVSPEAG